MLGCVWNVFGAGLCFAACWTLARLEWSYKAFGEGLSSCCIHYASNVIFGLAYLIAIKPLVALMETNVDLLLLCLVASLYTWCVFFVIDSASALWAIWFGIYLLWVGSEVNIFDFLLRALKCNHLNIVLTRLLFLPIYAVFKLLAMHQCFCYEALVQ